MNYMFLIYSQERREGPPTDEIESIKDRHWAVMEEAHKRGVQTATTIRYKDGHPITIDGPFAETKEQLAGY